MAEPEAPDDIYLDLRQRALRWGEDDPGIDVRGLITDIAYDEGIVTLACLADGATSMYTSRGGGVLGAGEYDHVAAANRRLVALAGSFKGSLPRAVEPALPLPGKVRFSILTSAGLRSALVEESELATRSHPLTSLYLGVQDVVTELGRIDTGGDTGGDSGSGTGGDSGSGTG